jgi:hypothetical protein
MSDWRNKNNPDLEFKISRVGNNRQGPGKKNQALHFESVALKTIFRTRELNFAGQEQPSSR